MNPRITSKRKHEEEKSADYNQTEQFQILRLKNVVCYEFLFYIFCYLKYSHSTLSHQLISWLYNAPGQQYFLMNEDPHPQLFILCASCIKCT